MITFFVCLLAFAIATFAWLLHGATSNRMRDKEKELDEWSGVTDVKRKTRDMLNDTDYVDRVQNEFNDK